MEHMQPTTSTTMHTGNHALCADMFVHICMPYTCTHAHMHTCTHVHTHTRMPIASIIRIIDAHVSSLPDLVCMRHSHSQIHFPQPVTDDHQDHHYQYMRSNKYNKESNEDAKNEWVCCISRASYR